MYTQISHAMTDPQQLEALYRENPKAFKEHFLSVFAEHPNSVILQVWHERLFFREDTPSHKISIPQEELSSSTMPSTWRWMRRDVLLIVALILPAGTLLKLPQWIPALNEEVFYLRNLSFIIGGTLILYFLVKGTGPKKQWAIIWGVIAGGILYNNLLPNIEDSQTLLLVSLHMPIVLWSLLGVAFTGSQWRITQSRWDFLRYNGELVIYASILSLGGMVLTFLTIQLFYLIEMDIAEWYAKTIGPYGAAAIPLVATFIIQRIAGNRFRIAPILAKIFTPLFLIMVVIYLLTIILARKSPYTDRDFLLVFNALLAVVLGLTVFSLSERQREVRSLRSDYVTFTLIVLTLVLDLVALSAIVFRLSSYGLTPNRLAVLGANLCILVHLVGIVYYHLRFLKQKRNFEQLITWVTHYLPVYTVWSIVVIVGFPIIFGFGHLNP